MYDFFYGKVISVAENYIILEVNNIGYKIFVINIKDIKLNYYIKLYIYNHVSDSINYLYGFDNKLDRDIFIKLLEVKSIGVKSAFNILKKYSSDELFNLVSYQDEENILKIPKITIKVLCKNYLILNMKILFILIVNFYQFLDL